MERLLWCWFKWLIFVSYKLFIAFGTSHRLAPSGIEQLELLRMLFEAGKYKATIDRTYPLDEIVEAHRYVETGRKKGNVVLKIAE